MDTLKKTPLYDVHIALGGKMVDFGGWALPVQYSSILEEHKAVRERCGLFDVSHMGELWVSGEGAFPYLQYMLTNDITTMTPGRCRYSMVCYEDGGTVDDVLVYKYSDTDYLVVVNASNTEKDFEWFAAHAIPTVQVENKSAEYAQLALQGPKFMQVLEAAGVDGAIPEKNYTFVQETKVAGIPCIVSRTGYTGEDGVELYCAAKDGPALHAALMEAGKCVNMLPCGLGARDTLRFEASMPLYGHEMDANVTPMETGISFAVKLNKEDFIGKEALLAPAKRIRIGLKLIDRGIAREHADVYLGEERVGHVTSGSPAPTLGGNYAMALVDLEDSEAPVYEIEVRGRRLKAEKTAMPFYKRAK